MKCLGKDIAAVPERTSIRLVTTRSVRPKEQGMEFEGVRLYSEPRCAERRLFPAIEMWCVWFFGPSALT